MNIRPFNAGDAASDAADDDADDSAAMANIFQRSVRGVGLLLYCARQVDAWAARGPNAARIRAQCADGRVVMVAERDDGAIIGFCDLEPNGHIDFLYCAPEAIRSGVGSALYQVIERAALNRNMRRLHCEASEAAKPFFINKGFSLIKRCDFWIENVPIHNFAMVKLL